MRDLSQVTTNAGVQPTRRRARRRRRLPQTWSPNHSHRLRNPQPFLLPASHCYQQRGQWIWLSGLVARMQLVNPSYRKVGPTQVGMGQAKRAHLCLRAGPFGTRRHPAEARLTPRGSSPAVVKRLRAMPLWSPSLSLSAPSAAYEEHESSTELIAGLKGTHRRTRAPAVARALSNHQRPSRNAPWSFQDLNPAIEGQGGVAAARKTAELPARRGG
jgi:hypothetical protein